MPAAKPDADGDYQPIAVIAQVIDLTGRRVQQLVAEGVLPKAAHGKYPVLACVQAYIHYLRAQVEGGTAYAERARLLKAQREKAELEVAAMRREMIPAKDVMRGWADMVGRCRSKLLALPVRLSTHAMTCATVRECEDFARGEVHAALDELANEIAEHVDDAEDDPPSDSDAMATAAAPDGQ